MKNKLTILIPLLCVLLCTKNAGAQITLDYSYTLTGRTSLYLVNLELSGPKYVLKCEDSGNRYLKFYNINHSLWKTINCNPFRTTQLVIGGTAPYKSSYVFGAYYISQSLFDCDTNIEFLYTSSTGTPDQSFVGIYNEHGTAVFSSDSSTVVINSSNA